MMGIRDPPSPPLNGYRVVYNHSSQKIKYPILIYIHNHGFQLVWKRSNILWFSVGYFLKPSGSLKYPELLVCYTGLVGIKEREIPAQHGFE